MRASSPSSCDAGHALSPGSPSSVPPSTIRQRRRPFAVADPGPTVAHYGDAQHLTDRDECGSGTRSSSMSPPKPEPCSRRGWSGEQHARAGGARPARTRRTCAAAAAPSRRTRRAPATTPTVDHVEQLAVVHQHGAAAGDEPLDERRPDRRGGADRQRPRQPCRRPAPGSTHHRRAAGGWPGPAPARARRCARRPAVSTAGHSPRRAGWSISASAACTAASRSTIAAAASSSSERQAITAPASTRTTRPSNTVRNADASVPRTSPYRRARASGPSVSITLDDIRVVGGLRLDAPRPPVARRRAGRRAGRRRAPARGRQAVAAAAARFEQPVLRPRLRRWCRAPAVR